ncbi:AAA family ATPase [Prolixibacter denitrificans]|uniref:Cytidylate kinase n=1 Tax=Prolixibacter denitrificans TaxID=1541063 RepID=A0A2P8CFR4_9BACT|nr:cytidylate kinase-like family protein [Prolixibacter denitrificans]PSK83815.1 cytidylate kinase [Prolixibacter denitrificans]GET23357.1 cytidylate kinase [Prolixibacter denitrificans]
MEQNILSNYSEVFRQQKLEGHISPGPVITISRECGCSAKRIATKLSKILTGYSYLSETKTDVEWRWISKEILEEASHELEMDPNHVKNVFLSEKKVPLEEVTSAFSTEKVYDADDQKVIETVGTVIRSFAVAGHHIIVGRGGEILSHGITDRLAIRLEAPLDWRVNRIMQISSLSHSDARDYVIEIDRQRDLFVEHIAGRKVNNSDFDLIFNYSTMLDDHIVDAIVSVLKNRHII